MSLRRMYALAAVIPLLVALATLLVQQPGGPVLFADELGYLGIGVDLSMRDAVVSLREIEYYSPGYGLFLAPVLSLTGADPWRVAVAFNLACVALLGPLAAVLVRDLFGLPRHRALWIAIVAACTPSIALQVPRAWPEILLATMTVAWAIALERFLRPRDSGEPLSPSWAPAMVATAVAGYVVHRRFVVLLLVSGAVVGVHLGLAVVRSMRTGSATGRLTSRAVTDPLGWATAAGAVLVAGLGAQHLLEHDIRARLYGGAQLVNATARAGELAGEDLPPRLVAGTWSIMHATLGVAALAILALVARARSRGPQRAWAAWFGVAWSGSATLSVLVIADGTRVDHLFYERYVAPVTLVAVAVALGHLAVSDRPVRQVVRAIGVVVASTAALAIAFGGLEFSGEVQKLTVPTLTAVELLRRGWGEPFLEGLTPLLPASVTVATLGIVLLVARWRPRFTPAVVGVVYVVATLVGGAGALRPFSDFWDPRGRDLATGVRDAGAGDGPIGWLPGTAGDIRPIVSYRLGYPPFVDIDEQQCPDVPVLLAPHAFAPDYDVVEVARSERPSVSLWEPRCEP